VKRTQELLIIDVWKPMDKEVVGGPELESIQETIAERFGTSVPPAAIARALADHGVRLGHPEILQADVRWRERNLLFSAEDLTFSTIDAATALVEKIENLRRQLENDAAMAERLRHEVRQFKIELDLLAANEKAANRDLAQEVAQWLTIWLQTPQIFSEWLSLRRATADFQARFSS
jgi:hypothetical protein